MLRDPSHFFEVLDPSPSARSMKSRAAREQTMWPVTIRASEARPSNCQSQRRMHGSCWNSRHSSGNHLKSKIICHFSSNKGHKSLWNPYKNHHFHIPFRFPWFSSRNQSRFKFRFPVTIRIPHISQEALRNPWDFDTQSPWHPPENPFDSRKS